MDEEQQDELGLPAWCYPEQVSADDVTRLLQGTADGQLSAAEILMPLIYEELRRIARSFLRRERADHTLQPTALVHEAYLRMVGQNRVTWQGRAHFFSIAAKMMRRILVDSSRRKLQYKRGGDVEILAITSDEIRGSGTPLSATDLLVIHEALERLAERDRRMVQVVELRFFAGLNNEEIAKVLQISEPTVKRSWAVARAWLARELSHA
jgi:RNA polymerase sigma factor (TIGR02999 family)